jgi:hypothetical protein
MFILHLKIKYVNEKYIYFKIILRYIISSINSSINYYIFYLYYNVLNKNIKYAI